MNEQLTFHGKHEFQQTTELTHDGILVVKNSQDVEPVVDALKYLKNNEQYANEGVKKGWLHVGHVPDVIIHKWMKEGFHIDRHTVKEIVARLHAEHMTDFLATKKNI